MAIKSFNTLIKLHKRRVDVIRREMRTLEEQRNQLLTLSATLHAEYAREVEISSSDAKMAGFFGAYAMRVQKRQEAIAQEVKKLETAIDEKAELVRAEFAEQKKYEIAKTFALKKLDEQEKHRQQSRFDEVAAQQFRKLQEMHIEERPV